MISFPFCKINLGLNVISKRDDGYHNIETCFYPIPWKDILEIIPSEVTEFSQTGISLPGERSDNIVFKAYDLLKKDFNLGPVQIHLHKIIPHGAGLGGGSSDGAHALKLLNQIFDLNLSSERLKNYALQLGSDCPFFLESGPMIASGRGEVLRSISLDLSGLNLVIVKPRVEVSTKQAYSSISPVIPTHDLKSILSEPVSQWRSILKNDFEEPVFKQHPVISEIKNKLYQLDALYASMSGSGSAVFGIFKDTIGAAQRFPNLTIWEGRIQ